MAVFFRFGKRVTVNWYLLPVTQPIPHNQQYVYIQSRNYSTKKSRKVELNEDELNVIKLDELRHDMSAALDTLKWDYTHTITTRLSPMIIGNLTITWKEKQMKLKDLSQISMPNSQNIIINFSSQPHYIQDAVNILQAKVNINPTVDGSVIKASLPKPSKEVREKLSKDAKSYADKAKVRIRRVRQQAISNLRKHGESVSKDSVKRIENIIQKITDENIDNIEKMLKAKTIELHKQ